MIGIFLDDERNPEDVTWINYPKNIDWFVVRTMSDFLFTIYNTNEKYCISFDHDICDYDISGKENTGYDCLKCLIDYCLHENKLMPKCYFHTKNIVGLQNMKQYYENFIKFFNIIN